jgi:hypothetical protein
MSHFWLAGDVTVDPLLLLMIRFCLLLVLTLMFGPRMDQEYFYKDWPLDIAIGPPCVGAITKPNARILPRRPHEL